MDTNTAQTKNPFGSSDMNLLPGKDIYLVIERQRDDELVLPYQILNKGGRAKVLADLMMGYYGTPIMIIRLCTDGTWKNVSSSFATFWFCKLTSQVQLAYKTLPMPPFLETYLHAEFRPDWSVNEAA